MDAQSNARAEQLLEALSFATSRVDADNIDRLVQSLLDVMGADIVGELKDDETVQFATACTVPKAGKDEPGLVVLTSERVLLAWSTGLRHPETHFESSPLGAEVSSRLERLGMLKGWRTHITVLGPGRLTFSVHDTKAGVMGNWVQGLASGAITRAPGQVPDAP